MANAKKEDRDETEPAIATLSKAVGYLCVVAAGLKDEPLLHSASFLLRLGYSRTDCAAILDSTPETIRVTLAQAKNRGASKKATKKQKEKGSR